MKVQARFLKPVIQLTAAACLFAFACSSHAQAIVRVQNAYTDDHERALPFGAAAPAGGEAKASPAVNADSMSQRSAGGATQRTWEVRVADVNIEATLKRWAKEAGFQLVWDTDKEFLIPASDSFAGSFEDALNRVLQSPGIRDSDDPLEAVIYANNPPLVRITRLGSK